jgi:thermopsin
MGKLVEHGIVVVVVLVALLFVMPGSNAFASGGSPASAASPTGATPPVAHTSAGVTGLPAATIASIQHRALEVARATGVPKSLGLEPNLAYQSVREGAAIVPAGLANPQVSPGPTSIGVNDLGLRVNGAGNFVPYSYRTTSIDGAVTLNSLSLLPVQANVSNGITIQENAVLNNMTLFGQSIYQVWAQNVILYSITGDQLQLLTDAWNFTGPYSYFSPSAIYQNSPGGMLFTGVYVHQVPIAPPAFIVKMPFTIRLYLNATNIAGRNALFFNYTLYSAHDIFLDGKDLGKQINDGSFDWIIFNSTAGQPAGYQAPPMSFLVSGSQGSGLGLANDAEIAICGPSDGYNADIRAMNASARLLVLNDSTGQYGAVPAAFTTTEDTGETVEGVDAHFTASSAAQGRAFLTAGPEFVYGLWNATPPGVHERAFHVDLSPSSSQLWVSPDGGGANAGFVNNSAAWAISASSDLTFWLPSGPGYRYSAVAMANDYAPQYFTLSPLATASITLSWDAAMGLYVPVLAFGNAAVASIARAGDGTEFDPYVLEWAQHQPISALYGLTNPFSEPMYPGLVLSGVSVYVEVWHPPSFAIDLNANDLFYLEYYWGLNPPSTNDLPMEVYDSSHISILGGPQISGWFPVSLTGFLYGSLLLSNVSDSLVAYNTFSSMGSSLVIVDPNGNRTNEHDVVFGNRFLVNPVVNGVHGSSLYVVLAFNTTYSGPPTVGGLGLFASGVLVYNNLFLTPITAYSPPQNPLLAYVFINDLGYPEFSGVRAVWHDTWNVSLSPATYTRFVNGVALFGPITGASFMGGNAWWNWNGVTTPYTDSGLITPGGDYLPAPL